MQFFDMLGKHLLRSLPLKGKRLPTMYPSAASCRDINNPTEIHGACMRQQWYRCAGYSESDPSGEYSQYIFAAGNMWEEWLTEQCKQQGIWVTNSLKWSIPEYFLSGEVDIVIRDPETDEVIILESKTYSSSNYDAKVELCGGRKRDKSIRIPTPKVQNVMQSALYLHYFSKPENGGVKRVLLTYFDRACGGPENNREFWVSLNPVTINNETKTYIHIDTVDIDGNSHSYDMPGVTMEGVFDRYMELINALRESKEAPPPPDYMHIYPKEKVLEYWSQDKISKTKYEKWESNPNKYPIGDWQCSYCGYKTLCKMQKEEQGYS